MKSPSPLLRAWLRSPQTKNTYIYKYIQVVISIYVHVSKCSLLYVVVSAGVHIDIALREMPMAWLRFHYMATSAGILSCFCNACTLTPASVSHHGYIYIYIYLYIYIYIPIYIYIYIYASKQQLQWSVRYNHQNNDA